MRILGIESSCDETAAAVIEDGRVVLSGCIASQVELHGVHGGVVPELASRCHIESITAVVDKALKDAKIERPDAVAVTYAPGLIGALLVGINFAKAYAYANDIPLIPVHHLRGHIAALYIEQKTLQPPFLCLVASGGHSHIVHVKDYTEFELLGRTVDDAAGEAFDKVARILGLGYPGGPAVAKAALMGDDTMYKLPTPKAQGEFDVSFSGLKTAVMNLKNNLEMKGEKIDHNSLAACFQSKTVDILASKLKAAADSIGCKTVCMAGGVAANTLLRDRIKADCDNSKREFFTPSILLCGDNAEMIAAAGYYELLRGKTADLDLNGVANRDIVVD